MAEITSIDAFTGKPIKEYALMDYASVKEKISSANAAFQKWRYVPLKKRIEMLGGALQYFEKNRDMVAKDISDQMGRPFLQAKREISGLLERAQYLGSIAEKALSAEILPAKEKFIRRIEHEPLGVIFIMAAWNYPLLIAINGVYASLLAGNSVLLKHSRITLSIGEHFERAFGKIREYDYLLQNLVLDHDTATRIIEEGRIHHVIFTGSVQGGGEIYQSVARRFTDCNLELGGKDGAYVAPDADLAQAAENLVDGAMYNSGQSCCGIERVYVHETVYDEFLRRSKEIISGYVLGDPMDPKTNLGPIPIPGAAERMEFKIRDAVEKGAKVVCGGKIRKIGNAIFFEPTLITGVNHGMLLMREENFGPIMPVVKVKDDEEAISLINDSEYGLTSVIFTSSLERAEAFRASADTGTVFMNRCDYLDPALPWTGVKNSGKGSSLSQYGLYSVTRRKSVHFRVQF